jgi:hypothetical protein
LSLVTSSPTSFGAARRFEKIARFAALKHGIAQVAGGDETRGELRDFAFLLFDDFIEDVQI